tara:strand:- start:348 stop:794 length:447 start_codon:yes stop_codon:yes gene_type:complete
MSVTVTKNFDLGRINLDLSRTLNEAADVVVLDIENGIKYGRDITGSPMTKLQPDTIADKRKKGYPSPRTALFATGTMKKVYIPKSKRANKTRQVVEIIVAKKRDDVGVYHQKGGGNLPKREWFGISKTAEKRAFNLLEMRVEQELRRA